MSNNIIGNVGDTNIITTVIDGGNITGKISGLSTQTLETMVKDIDSRVDTIITTPVESVSAQEIIDARGGDVTLGARVNGIVSQLAEIETEGILVGDGTKYGYFSINRERTSIDYHAYEDWSRLNTTDTDLGYCSFDAKPTLTNNLRQSHLVGYQARPIYNGSGDLKDYLHGYDTDMKHTGTGTIANAVGMYIKDVEGTGPITNDYGLYIRPIYRGSVINWGIYSDNNKNFLKGLDTKIIRSNGQSLAITFGDDLASKNITFGYQSGAVNNGSYNFYNGITTLLATLDNTGFKVNKQVTVGSYTYAQLPAAVKGAIAYCTNGRKSGEAAGTGTGVLVYYDGVWRAIDSHVLVTI